MADVVPIAGNEMTSAMGRYERSVRTRMSPSILLPGSEAIVSTQIR